VAAVNGPLVLALEGLERTALACGVHLLHPFCDPDLIDFLLELPPEVKFSRGVTKALARAAYPELPPLVRDRPQKTAFNDVAIAGASPGEILSELRRGAPQLDLIDHASLEESLRVRDIGFAERALLARLLSAERFVGMA
jgi:hypothetical protein